MLYFLIVCSQSCIGIYLRRCEHSQMAYISKAGFVHHFFVSAFIILWGLKCLLASCIVHCDEVTFWDCPLAYWLIYNQKLFSKHKLLVLEERPGFHAQHTATACLSLCFGDSHPSLRRRYSFLPTSIHSWRWDPSVSQLPWAGTLRKATGGYWYV